MRNAFSLHPDSYCTSRAAGTNLFYLLYVITQLTWLSASSEIGAYTKWIFTVLVRLFKT